MHDQEFRFHPADRRLCRSRGPTDTTICNTDKHYIVIDVPPNAGNGTYRYRAWNKRAANTARLGKPDMEITQSGVRSLMGTGVCATTEYHFTKGNAEFTVDDGVNCTEGHPPQNAVGNLWVSINNDLKLHSYCVKN
ncbi:hypothetical protein [Burkholderia vietnamiensis]|uniref:hypothetical protein n=1 Tax=Burkholderia vietnamiensis TaxID=60552 RepID=UPI001594D32B|nr:hypothetical protein [Burkholderia vietnamiensis]MBH9647544.1 hypothetical protein [Burkholderia vietnamiensis]MBR8007853.1 hypothetical protein [Burkholderia vietnamiensis]MBR8206054.1 hypothetical protein [Burkholderia vietnamiensis]MCA8289870.1 hypothetical protein [Burkholderia vietnamiensis]